MHKLLFLFIPLLLSQLAHAQQVPSPGTTGTFSIGEFVTFQSEILGETRRINVYLPATYASDSLKNYPVIYLLDGSEDEDFIHIAGLVQFGTFSWINMLPECIVVGISNVDRRRDFTYPTRNKQDKAANPTSGKSAKFIEFLGAELQPFIGRRYRTNGENSLIGQSLGGLLATEILFRQPDMFDQYFIVSPSLWWDDESLLKLKPLPYTGKKSIYIAVGEEGKVMKRVAKTLYKRLKQGNNGNTRLFFEFFPKQDHGDVLHLAIYNGFEKVFRAKQQ